MAKAKYSKGKDSYFRAKVWDGTYNPDGSKHRINIISKKSSADLEKKVNEFKDKVYKREYVTSSDISLYDYATEWLDTYKVNRSRNTYLMYKNIIDKHILDQVPSISTKMIAKLLGDTERMVSEVYSHILAEKEQVNDSIEKAISL